MNLCRLARRKVFVQRLASKMTRNSLHLSTFCMSVILVAQVQTIHTEPAMQCADTSKRESGDVIVTDICAFKITIQASTSSGIRSIRNLEPGGSAPVAGSAHSTWRVFACTAPGTPRDPGGKEVTYATLNYECKVQTASPQTLSSPQPTGEITTGEITSAQVATDEIKTAMARVYADAHPYMDEALPDLKKMVRELAGLKPDPGSQQPSDLLANVGAKADELLHKVPDLISDEAVSQTQTPRSVGLTPGCVGTGGCQTTGLNSSRDQSFSYLIITRPAPGGRLALQEYRTNSKGKPVQGVGAPSFQGFISAWVIFSSPNQMESRFRYLGQQKTDGHSTYVIGFAQNPAEVESPGVIVSDSESVPMLFQGIAWVDQSDYSIVRLRTDLLAPLPAISVQRQTANMLFGPARIPTLDVTLWLPQAVHVEIESKEQILQEEHKYSKYRLYKAQTKIILSPDN
jgi:hypothetical protein